MKYIIYFFLSILLLSTIALIISISYQDKELIHSSLIVFFASIVSIGIMILALDKSKT